MGVADRTLKTFDYISKGLLPSDDARIREESGRTNTGLLFREERTRGRQPDGFEGTGLGLGGGFRTGNPGRRASYRGLGSLRENHRPYLIPFHPPSVR